MSSDVADELRGLAARALPVEATLLTRTATAIENKQSSRDLLAIDWFMLLDDVRPPSSNLTLLGNAVEGIRDVGFVAPIVFLWFELRRAVGAYDGRGSATFFGQWQTGFSGKTDTFGTTALIVLGILGGLVIATILTVLIRSSETRAVESQVSRNRALARRLITELIATAPDPNQLVGDAVSAAKALKGPVAAAAAIVQRLGDAVAPLAKTMQQQEAYTARIAQSAESVAADAGGIGRSADHLATRSAQLLSGLGDAVARSAVALEAAVAASERLEVSTQSSLAFATRLEAIAERLQHSTETLARSADDAARTFANLRIQIDDLEQKAL